ncbi:hypothetical protein L1987_46838 [Smallanthus sonchifolius]|uniref:Uncharacterized protein n=1 Tax=Smallanthus sonchifolius TaxID=185202 RepID=A0ACB9G0Y7_9ASTR|nr:hypothetical protein L1987_46838 [Smallanthus sonchifolius]
MNQEVVSIPVESKEDIWNNDELFSLVKDFFDLSLLTLDFCTSLQDCLKNARLSLSFLRIAINQFDGDNDYLKTIEQFKKFEALDGPFSVEFLELFQSVYKQQVLMLKKLQVQKDKKLKSAKAWRRLTNVIFLITFSTILICSVVAAAVAAPPLVMALAVAAAMPLGPMGNWVNSLWKRYRSELKGQRELISSMRRGNYIVIKDLDNIKALVDKLGIEIGVWYKTLNSRSKKRKRRR